MYQGLDQIREIQKERESKRKKKDKFLKKTILVRTNIKKRKRAEDMAETIIDDILDFSDMKSLTNKNDTKVTLTYILAGYYF